MWLDLVIVVTGLLAFIHGFRKGFILSLFTLAGWVAGIAAAIAFCSAIVQWLNSTFDLHGALIPVLAFIALLFLVHFIIIQIGRLLEKLVSILFLGLLSKLLGGILQTTIYLSVLSVVLYFMKQGGMLPDDIIQQSKTYSFIEPWGNYFVHEMATLWPFFEKQLINLEIILKELAEKIQK